MENIPSAPDPNDHAHGMVPGSNSFPPNDALAPQMKNHNVNIQAGDSLAECQFWPIMAGGFTLQYPSSAVDGDEAFRATDQWLQHDPDYNYPNQDRDILSSTPAAPITTPFYLGKSREINEEPTPIPLPPTNYPQELKLYQYFATHPHDRTDQNGQSLLLSKGELFVDASLERHIAAVDGLYKAPQDGQFPQIAPRHQNPANVRHRLARDVISLPVSTPARKSQRCFECCFAHKPCTNSIPGSPCDRCTRMYNKMQVGPRHSKRLNDASSLYVDFVLFFDMRSTQNLLTRLRGAAEAITNLRPGVTLENCFDGPIVCHMDNRIVPHSSFSVTGVPVVIKHLATTRTALALAESLNQRFPLPGLDEIQMDGFIDVSNRMHDLRELHQSEQAIIITALRCSDYIGILFNWDLNAICFEGISFTPQAKNLVLETAYAMAYRVQQLLMILCYEVNQSLLGNYVQDPATIACALRIVYQSINYYQKLEWHTGSLQDLKIFLNGLHDRAPAALRALDRYRVNIAFLRCGEKSQNVKALQAIIDSKKTAKCAISFTYEQFCIDGHVLRLPGRYSQQTYTQVLETRIVNWDSFEFKPFSPSDFDRIEHRIFENSEMSHTTGPPSNDALAGLLQKDKTSTAKPLTGSVISLSCETDFVCDAGSEHDEDISIPSLTMNKTLSEENKASHDAEIQHAETSLENLKKIKSSERHLSDNTDMHEERVGFEVEQGLPIDVEYKARVAKTHSKAIEAVSPLINLAKSVNLDKRRRLQKTSSPHLAVQPPSSLSAPPSPATKRLRAGESTPEPIIIPRINHDTDIFDQSDISSGWDHDFNYELYEAMNHIFS